MTLFRCLLLLSLNLTAPASRAQDPPKPPAAAVPTAEQSVRLIHLRDKLAVQREARAKLEKTRTDLRATPPPSTEEKARLEALEESQAATLDTLTAELSQELTGVSDPIIAPEKTDNGLEAQFREVVKPALEMVNDMMKQPRETADMRRAVEQRKKEIAALDRALTGLNKTTTEIEAEKDVINNAGLREEIDQRRSDYTQRRAQKQSELTVFEKRLEELLAERQGFGEYAAKLWSGLVLQTMVNLLLAVAAFTGVLLLLRWFRRILARRGLRKRLQASPFVARATDLLYHIISVIAAGAAGFVILWVRGDWLLLTLAMLLVAGLVLLGRHTLPRMMDQARLILNLGGVREGERLIWHGLPWLVKRLHFASVLQNPALTGGTVRLPVRALADMLSRPYGIKEPWFPTNEGDWVELSDGTVGKVVLQTPETVQIVPVGGSFKNYTTTDFLAKTPRNLSHNFRIESRFGLDYRHSVEVLREAPESFAEALRAGYRRLVEESDIIRVNVEFAEAAASSLDLLVLADFTGKAAPHYAALKRLTQRICMETAVERKWQVAFPQMVLHRAGEVTT
jgi:hypothetical protein